MLSSGEITTPCGTPDAEPENQLEQPTSRSSSLTRTPLCGSTSCRTVSKRRADQVEDTGLALDDARDAVHELMRSPLRQVNHTTGLEAARRSAPYQIESNLHTRSRIAGIERRDRAPVIGISFSSPAAARRCARSVRSYLFEELPATAPRVLDVTPSMPGAFSAGIAYLLSVPSCRR